jgi:hypothetical protein
MGWEDTLSSQRGAVIACIVIACIVIAYHRSLRMGDWVLVTGWLEFNIWNGVFASCVWVVSVSEGWQRGELREIEL